FRIGRTSIRSKPYRTIGRVAARSSLAGVGDANLPAGAARIAETLGGGFLCVAAGAVVRAVADARIDELALLAQVAVRRGARVTAEAVDALLVRRAAEAAVRRRLRVRNARAVFADFVRAAR